MPINQQNAKALGFVTCFISFSIGVLTWNNSNPWIYAALILGMIGCAAFIAAAYLHPAVEYKVIAYTDNTRQHVIVNAKPVKTKPIRFPVEISCDRHTYRFLERKDETNAIYFCSDPF